MPKEKKKNERDALSPSKVSDWVRRTLMTGVGAIFMTEESVRNALSDMRMPKHVIAVAVAQVEKTKKEISSLVAKEVRQFLDGIEVAEIMQKALAGQTIEITATIKFTDGKNVAKKKAVIRPPKLKA
jgi:hypothetical protein